MTSALPMTEGPIDIIKLMDDSGFATSILANSQNKNGFPYPRSKSQVSEALVIDPRKDLISTSAILVDLARLRIQALANEIGDTVNASALETTQLALEDVWDDIAVTTRIAASRILDFSPEQMGKLTKLLPWVAIENAVWTYSRCIVATESTEGHGVFTDKANQRRAHATFSVRIEYALSPEELITEAKRMLSGHKDPFQNLAEHYTNLHSRAQPSLALPFLLPASSAPSVPSTKLVAARAAAFSLGHCGREKEATCAVTEEQQGTDLSDYGSSTQCLGVVQRMAHIHYISLNRTPSGYANLRRHRRALQASQRGHIRPTPQRHSSPTTLTHHQRYIWGSYNAEY
eukprot:m.64071 g.64071  ORF g.64071 m.64071 type:complete len:345 (-) comp15873_c0_seq3:2475-3509(-)